MNPIVIVLFAAMACAKLHCHKDVSCVDCLAIKNCIFIKIQEGQLCIPTRSLYDYRPLRSYRLKSACMNIREPLPAAFVDTKVKDYISPALNDTLLKPVLPELNRNYTSLSVGPVSHFHAQKNTSKHEVTLTKEASAHKRISSEPQEKVNIQNAHSSLEKYPLAKILKVRQEETADIVPSPTYVPHATQIGRTPIQAAHEETFVKTSPSTIIRVSQEKGLSTPNSSLPSKTQQEKQIERMEIQREIHMRPHTSTAPKVLNMNQGVKGAPRINLTVSESKNQSGEVVEADQTLGLQNQTVPSIPFYGRDLFSVTIPIKPWACDFKCDENLQQRLEGSICRTHILSQRYAKVNKSNVALIEWDQGSPGNGLILYCEYIKYKRNICCRRK